MFKNISPLNLVTSDDEDGESWGNSRNSLITNFVRINRLGPLLTYRLKIVPNVSEPDERMAIFKKLVEMLQINKNNIHYFRFDSTMASPTALESTSGHEVELNCKIYKVSWKPIPQEDIHLKDLCDKIFGKAMKHFNRTGNNRTWNFYDRENVIKLEKEKVDIWKGASIRTHHVSIGLVARFDVFYRVLRSETVLDVINIFKSTSMEKEEWQDMFMEKMRNYVVLTRYDDTYHTIVDVDWSLSPLSSEPGSESKVSFKNSIQDCFGVDVKDDHQPILICRGNSRRKTNAGIEESHYIIPELSYMTEIHSSEKQTKNKIRNIVIASPEARLKSLHSLLGRIIDCQYAMDLFKTWNLELGRTLVETEFSVIDKPCIEIDGVKQLADCDEMAPTTVLHLKYPKKLQKWILFHDKNDKDKADHFIQVFLEMSGRLGMEIVGSPIIATFKASDSFPFKSFFEKSISENPDVQFAICLISSLRKLTYSSFKQSCLLTRHLPSSCIESKHIRNQQCDMRTIVHNIVLKLNCKLGGANWSMKMPTEKKIMFAGMDVYHDPAMINRSVAAVVINLNNECTKYYTRVVFQGVHQEIIDSLDTIFKDALDEYEMINGRGPDAVIIYRDGVHRSKFDACINYESVNIKKGISQGSSAPESYTFIICSKRIRERFILMDRSNGRNPAPGTIVNSTVTISENDDFFLISQNPFKGCSIPAHYVVLDKQGNVDIDAIKKYTYHLCYMYYNFTSSARIPAPAQLAHKAAGLAGKHLYEEPHPSSNNILYYM